MRDDDDSTELQELAEEDFMTDARADGEPYYTDSDLGKIQVWRHYRAAHGAQALHERLPDGVPLEFRALDGETPIEIFGVPGDSEQDQVRYASDLLELVEREGIPMDGIVVHFDYDLLEAAVAEVRKATLEGERTNLRAVARRQYDPDNGQVASQKLGTGSDTMTVGEILKELDGYYPDHFPEQVRPELGRTIETFVVRYGQGNPRLALAVFDAAMTREDEVLPASIVRKTDDRYAG